MKKPLTFAELSEQAKKQAASEVAEIEIPMEDWSYEITVIQESMANYLEEQKIEHEKINWENRYGVHLDLSSLNVTDEFYKIHLTEKQMLTIGALETLSWNGIEHDTFYQNDIFNIHGNYADFEAEEGFEFLNEYGTTEEKEEFAFLALFEDDLTKEQEVKLAAIVEKIAKRCASEIEDVVRPILEKIKSELTEVVTKEIDYFESEKRYYDAMNEDVDYLVEKYRFNEEGNIVQIHGEFQDEHEEDYAECGELQESA